MNNKNLFFIISLLLIFISKCEEEKNNTKEGAELNDEFDDDAFFKQSLKQYLVDHGLFESNKVLQREEVRKILLEVLTEGEPDSTPHGLKKILDQLVDYFVNLYYKDRKEVKAEDLYELFDINQISSKFQVMVGDIPEIEDLLEEEDINYDKRDEIGKPNSDI